MAICAPAAKMSLVAEVKILRAGAAPNHRPIGFAAAGLVFLADQLSKWAITNPLALQQRGVISVLPIFDLKWVENYGVSMGFLTAGSDSGRWLLVLLTAAIATGVIVWLWRERQRPDAIALGMVLGGALGNILDRVRFGYVTDFADLHFGDFRPFLVFNVGDAAISIGVVILLLHAFLSRKDAQEETVEHA